MVLVYTYLLLQLILLVKNRCIIDCLIAILGAYLGAQLTYKLSWQAISTLQGMQYYGVGLYIPIIATYLISKEK